jgi:signal transduction histidine kinase
MSPLRKTRPGFASSAELALRVVLILTPLTTLVLIASDLFREAEPRWFLFALSILPSAAIMAEKSLLKSDSAQSESSSRDGARISEAEGEEREPTVIPVSPENTGAQVACPVEESSCWVIDALDSHFRVSRDLFAFADDPTAPSQIARHACQMMDAQAAWLFRTVDGATRLHLASDHVPMEDADDRNEAGGRALQLAEKLVLAAERHQMRDSEAPSVVAEGGFLAVLLSCRYDPLGAIVMLNGERAAQDYLARHESLTSLARQATLSLENALLRETQKELETKLRQIGLHRTDYVATLSHELRTPLTSIKGFAQLLMRSDFITDEAARRYATTIATEADKLAMIVTDIVDLTRMETGLLELHRRPISMGRLVRTVVQRLQPMAFPQQLAVSIPDRLPIMRGDPERLDQVLGRLLVDSIVQASPGSTILLSAEAGEDGIAVRLEYPASEDRISSLNEAMKGPNSHSNDDQATQLGRGRLGLYICKNYIEAHGGRMWVESPEEQTARVVFTLPY